MTDIGVLRDTDKLLVNRDGESYYVSFYQFNASQPWFPVWDQIIGLITEVDGGAAPDTSLDRDRPLDNGFATDTPLPGIDGGGRNFPHIMSPKTTTEVVTKALARSGPELRPDQIRLADEAQIDPKKVYTQSDVNQNGGGGGGGGVAPEDLAHLATKEELSTEADARDTGDKANLGLIEAANLKIQGNTAEIQKSATKAELLSEHTAWTTADTKIQEAYIKSDTALATSIGENAEDIKGLQSAFDTAVIAAQEGAENLEIELQSYAKKEDIPEDVNLEGYAKTDYVDSADQALNALIAANTQAIEDIDIPEGAGPDPRLPYEFVVGEQDSNDILIDKEGSNEVAPTQILETLTLKDAEGNECGAVAFESGGGIGVALSQRFENTILIQGAELEKAINTNTEAIAAIEVPEYKTPTLDEVCKAGYVTTQTLGVKGISTTDTFDARGKHNGVEYAHFYGSDSKSDLKVQDNIVTVGDNTRDAGATLNVIGTCNATEFVGDGSQLTGLPSPTYVDWNNLPNLTV